MQTHEKKILRKNKICKSNMCKKYMKEKWNMWTKSVQKGTKEEQNAR